MTSTPTASSERTRLCAPVMPVAGSARPRRRSGRRSRRRPATAAASRVACLARRWWSSRRSPGPVRYGCLLGRATCVPGNKKPLVPQARRGQRVGRATDALGDYEAAGQRDEQAGAGHPHTVRPVGPARQPTRPTRWTPVSICMARRRLAVQHGRVEARRSAAAQLGGGDRAGRAGSPAGSGSPAARTAQLAGGLHALGDDVHARASGPARRRRPPAPRRAGRARCRRRTRGPS